MTTRTLGSTNTRVTTHGSRTVIPESMSEELKRRLPLELLLDEQREIAREMRAAAKPATATRASGLVTQEAMRALERSSAEADATYRQLRDLRSRMGPDHPDWPTVEASLWVAGRACNRHAFLRSVARAGKADMTIDPPSELEAELIPLLPEVIEEIRGHLNAQLSGA